MADSETLRVMVITGAGASRNLGDPPMPLMEDWATQLILALNEAEPGLADAIDLNERHIPGDRFEKCLGDFLEFEEARKIYDRYKSLGFGDLRQSEPFPAQWSAKVAERCHRILDVIHRNLFASFGATRFNVGAAEQAYSDLRLQLDSVTLEGFESVWYATTNYDCSIETGELEAGRSILDGFYPSSNYATQRLNTDAIAQLALTQTNAVPVLHLHGAVGWYRDGSDGIIRFAADRDYEPALGVPALLLPDNRKTALSFTGGQGLWSTLERLLQDCTHVLFLGHSLHDEHLVGLVRRFTRQLRIGVTYFAQGVPTDEEREAQQRLVENSFLNAVAIGCSFGPTVEFDDRALGRWAHGEPESTG